ncbi:stage II sporulation protein D [Fontibacillus solani]|uniref:Stage II sporulation protein D n=1 Tax=Fontibacillus solani TaxID=1572857 RepID=A0A7W3XUN8_9BACL|nr:SpoIID/LytB domain-containing protein [Fontibacillus solani]MBA9088819.1 stage II sporulation protein D [Fontibacillus solani]
MVLNKTGMKISRWGKGILSGFLLLGALQLPVSSVSADSSIDRTVRVALFLDAGSTYKSTVPAVTLKAESEWSAGFSFGGGFESWVQLNAGQSARFSVDGFKVKAMESKDWSIVSAAVKKLQGTADKPVLIALDQGGSTFYQIFTGPYASADEASKAATRVASSISGQLKGQAPEVRGSYYYTAGSFGNKGEAESLRQSISSQGVDAYVVLTAPQQFAVWVGGMASENDLAGLQAQLAQTMPQVSLAPVNQGTGLIEFKDATLNLEAPSPVDHYKLTGADAKLIIRDGEQSVIQVTERSARQYRGDFEISNYNGQLALVNEISLDQYLYSVVAAEVPSSWHLESLKAQAVAARSYALYNSAINKFKVAGLVDTTLSQVYNGVDKEIASITEAVDSTAGEVIMANGKVVEGVFSSNSGGVTADSSEVWNSVNSIYSSTLSQEDKAAEASLKSWYHVLLSTGKTGYIREDNIVLTGGSTAAGLKKLAVTTSSVMVRPLPIIQSNVEPVAKMNPGDEAIILDKVSESSSYAWVRGPFSSDDLVKSLKGKTVTEAPATITNLEVTQRGPSGRVLQVKANGQILDVKYPDLYRSALGGLPSTLFDIVAIGRYTVQGAGDVRSTATSTSGTTVLSSSGVKTSSGNNLVVMGADGVSRVVEQSNEFMFVGRGNGHGIGLSQWGAKGMADAGYDYRQILQHYYQNVSIVRNEQ